MSDSRPILTSSLSFAGTSSASAISRPIKRRLTATPDLSFFTPAAQSFKPRPYVPAANSAPDVKPLSPPTITTMRGHSSSTSLAQSVAVMDPSPSDPYAIFIHPPFTSFPNSHLHPEGLSYALMAANPEWFLDPHDFVSSTPTPADNQDVIPYPPQLEPPRGWCPAKKKDLKALGAEGWPEGEEPRLRCTFCRRTYAGVNAKSMWRRHVYEKHKIAMSNRREGNDRSRGRGANKENKHQHSDKENHSDESQSSIKLESMSPQDNYNPFSGASSSSHLNSVMSSVPDELSAPSAPYIEQKEFPVPTISLDYAQTQLDQHPVPSMSPPMTPPSLSPKILKGSFSEPNSPSPKPLQPIIPPSPYNPLLTPSFRHNPPRLPSDQPWRFPSPSHPLHSRARELCLGTLVQGEPSPSTKIVTIADSSPARMLNTPTVFPHKTADGILLDSDNTDHIDGSPNILRPSPRSLFGPGMSSFSDVIDLGGYRSRADESPLSRLMRRKTHSRQKSTLSSFSEVNHDWFSDLSSTGLVGGSDHHGLNTPIRLENDDPFAGMYNPWIKESKSAIDGYGVEEGGRVVGMSSPGTESPVLRSSQLHHESIIPGQSSHPIGLGIGLMGPFTYADEDYQQIIGGDDDVDADSDFSLVYPPSPREGRRRDQKWAASRHSELQTAFTLRRVHAAMMNGTETRPGAEVDMDALNELHDSPYESPAPPMKRRRTTS